MIEYRSSEASISREQCLCESLDARASQRQRLLQSKSIDREELVLFV